MNFYYSPYVLPLLIVSLLSGSVMLFAWKRRSSPDAASLLLMAFGITEWLVGYALEIAGTDLATKLLWGKLQYIGITLVPLSWAVFSYYHAYPGKRPQPRTMMALAAIPIMTTLLAFTTDLHGLVWKSIDIKESAGFSALAVEYGFWFWIHTAYSYMLLLTGTVFTVRSLFRSQGLYRGQAAALIVALLAPWLGNVLFLSGMSPVPNLDLTPFAFAVSVLALAWGILGYQLASISPIAREQVVDGMRDGMVVLDIQANVADMNPAAAHMLGVRISDVLGKPIAFVLQPWPELLDRLRNVSDAVEEILVGQGEASRRYEITVSPLVDSVKRPLGRLFTIRQLDASAPAARPALKETPTAPLRDVEKPVPVPPPTSRLRQMLGWLVDFITVPVNPNQAIPAGVNPKWFVARERSFTLILRVAAMLGTLGLLVAPIMGNLTVGLPFAVIIALLWFLALSRNVNFSLRTSIYLLLVYALAFIETMNFGFSVESFSFFLTLVISAVLLWGRDGGWGVFALTVATLGLFAFLIGGGSYLPPLSHGGIPDPATIQRGLTSMVVFAACAAALGVSVTILMESLNSAWQLETQALNLLQQERDMLDQRVRERTHELATARDEAIRTSNDLQKYFLAIEQSGNTIVITDLKGNIEYANPKFSLLTGYSLDEAIGQNPRILQSGEHSREFYAEMWETISSGNVWKGQFHNRRKDGSLFWEAATIAPVFNHLGKITNYVAVKENITDQKELEEKLLLQNEQLTAEVAERMRFERQNQAFLDDMKALQEVWLELSQADDLEQLYIQMIQLSQSRLGFDRMGLFIIDEQTGELQGTYGIGPDGSVRDERYYHEPISPDHWTLEIVNTQNHSRMWENAPVYDDGREVGVGWKVAASLWNGHDAIGYLVTDNFVTRRVPRPYEEELVSLLGSTFGHLVENKRADALISESELRFRQIVENASDLIYRADMNGKFTYANPTALRMMGFQNESDVVGRHFLDLTYPAMRHKVNRFYMHQMLSEIDNTYYEVPALTNDGREIWLGQNVQLIRRDKKVVGFQSVARDVTEIRQAFEALAIARDRALEADQFKSQILSRVSHELRTPLGGIMGYAELLRDGTFGPLDEEQTEAAAQIATSAEYLAAIVNDLLDEAQMESHGLSLNIARFSPQSILEQVQSRMIILAKNKNLDLNVSLDDGFPEFLYGDEKRLQQILINLVGNAIKFTREGSVDIRFFCPDNVSWAMQVRDTGAGIPPDAQQYIFEAFRQVDNAITRENRGTGLGLSIVSQLVEIMDGNIQLESEVGKGSTFTVILPVRSVKETE